MAAMSGKQAYVVIRVMAWHPEHGKALPLYSIGAQGSAVDCQRRVYGSAIRIRAGRRVTSVTAPTGYCGILGLC